MRGNTKALVATALIVGLTMPVVAMAQDGDVNQGFGAWLLAALFESGSITAPPEEPGLIGTVIKPLGLMAMIVAMAMIIGKSIQHVLIVAQAKDPEASPVSMTWAPIHMVLAVALIMPTPSGYSAGQHAGIWVGEQSNLLANIITNRLVSFFENNGTITPIPSPSTKPIVDAAVNAAICKQLVRDGGGFVQSVGGTPPSVSMNVLGSNASNPYAPQPYSDYQTSTVLNEIGMNGDQYNLPTSKTRPACGGVTVAFRNQFDVQMDDNQPDPDANPTFRSIPEGSPSGYASISQSVREMTQSEDDRQTIERATNAHAETIEVVRDLATGETAGPESIAQNLLFDLETHIEVLTANNQEDAQEAQQDLEQMLQEDEANYINEAAAQTVQLYKDMERNVHSHYAKALQEQRMDDGRNWTDTIDKVGWPAVGLYWMQFSAINDRVKEAVDVTVAPIDPVLSPEQISIMLIGDESLANRIEARIATYRDQVRAQLGDDPLASHLASGNDDRTAKLQKFENTKDTMVDKSIEMLSNAGGEYEGDDFAVTRLASDIFRDGVFPFMVWTLRRDENVLVNLTSTGHLIIGIGETAYVASKFLQGAEGTAEMVSAEGILETGSKWLNRGIAAVSTGGATASLTIAGKGVTELVQTALQNPFTHALYEGLKDMFTYMSLLIIPGLFLAFYLPAAIMIQWLTQLVTWLIYVVEAVIVIPIWGILFVSDMGQQALAPQTARQGFVHLLSILLYPSLMVIGFVVGLKVVDLISAFLIDFLMVGFLNATDGYMFGIVSSIAGLAIIGLACYQILMRIFSSMMEMNDRVIGWIGNRPSYGEAQAENATRSAIVGFAQRGEMKGNPNKQKQMDQQNKGQGGNQGGGSNQQ